MEEILVTYEEIKQELLKNRNCLMNQKIMSMNELVSKLLFSYDEHAIYYLMQQYHFRYEVAKVYLNNIIQLLESNSTLYKKMINDLLEQKLLTADSLFKTSLANKKIVIYHYPISKWEQYLLNKNQCHYEIQPLEVVAKKYDVYEFSSIEEEVNFVALQIINLIKHQVDMNHIKLMNVMDEYKPYISRIFKMYHLPIEQSFSLYSKREISAFITELKHTRNLSFSLNKIENIDLRKKVLQIINQYSFIEQVDDILIEILISELKNTYVKSSIYQNKIEEISHPTQNDIIFVLGFNDSFPKFYKDEDFLSDEIKESLGIDTSTEKNVLLEEQILKEFSHAKQVFLTYSTKTKSGNYQISPLSEKMDYTIIHEFQDDFGYSDTYNQIKLAKMLDEKAKFNVISPNLGKLLNHYPKIQYQHYNNQFTGISNLKLYKFLDNKIVLSYSSIDNYYKCQFRFYLNNILKITPFEETFAIKIGNIFHHILEKYNLPDFQYEFEFEREINQMNFTSKEKVFLGKLKKDLKFVIDTIQKQNKWSTFSLEQHEKKVFVNKDKTISVTFMGVIDKIKYTNHDGKTLLAIIDYKTGNPITSLTKTLYGLDMQLPIYLYLTKQMKEFSNVEVVGIYLQKILNNEPSYDAKKDYYKQKEEQLKLEGYSLDNQELLSLFDTTYQDSEIIKGMKTSKNGFYAYTKTITKEQLDHLYDLVDHNINQARDHILEADFLINPKKIGIETTCKFCPYSDICYKKEEDFIELEIPDNIDFLNEVDYAKVDR